jgi:hypothetical protein
MFDVITDLKCEYVDYKVRVDNNVIKGKVHSGMLLAARNVSLRIKSVVTHILKEHPNYRLCITGHSLGAGIGSMLALIWLSDPFLKDKNIQVFGISPPATLTSELNQVLKKFVISASFGNDIFAKLSIGSIRDIAQMNLFLQKKEDETNFTAGKVVKSIFTGPTAEKEYIDLYQEYKDFSKSLHYSRLVPPGYSFQIFDRAQHQEYTSAFEHENSYRFENKYVGVFLRPEYHQEIIFSKTLISDHSSIQIEKSLELLMGIKRKKLLESDPEDIIGETETPELETLEDEQEIVEEEVENPYRA